MSDQLTVEEWKAFLKARVVQEAGNDAEALKTFDSLLAVHPTNPHLLASRTAALSRMGKGREALAGKIATEYARAGKALTGANDKSDVWQAELNRMLGELDTIESTGTLAAAAVAW